MAIQTIEDYAQPGEVRDIEVPGGKRSTSLAIPDDVLLEHFAPRSKKKSKESVERKNEALLERRYERYRSNVERGEFSNGKPLPELERRCTEITLMPDGREIGCLTYRVEGQEHCFAHSPDNLWKTDREAAKAHGAKGRLTLRRRAALRAFYTQGGKTSPRGHLAALAHIEKHSIAEKVIEAVTLQPETHAEAMAQANLAIKLLDAVDPLTEARLELELPDSLEDVEGLDFATIARLAGRETDVQLGIPS